MSIHNPKENRYKEHEVESVKCPYLQGPRTKRKVIKKKKRDKCPARVDTLSRMGKGKLINQSSTEQSPVKPTIDGLP